MNQVSTSQNPDPEESRRLGPLKNLTGVIYLLQALAFVLGGITAIIAVIINYVKRADVKGTWLESHFTWQINTFWFALILTLVGVATLAVGIGHFVLIGAAVFVVYRIVRGWMRLNINQAIQDTELGTD
jgi:uncharacterized membrane protein